VWSISIFVEFSQGQHWGCSISPKQHLLIQSVCHESYPAELLDGKEREELIKIHIPRFLPRSPEPESLGGKGVGKLGGF